MSDLQIATDLRDIDVQQPAAQVETQQPPVEQVQQEDANLYDDVPMNLDQNIPQPEKTNTKNIWTVILIIVIIIAIVGLIIWLIVYLSKENYQNLEFTPFQQTTKIIKDKSGKIIKKQIYNDDGQQDVIDTSSFQYLVQQ